MNDDQFVLKQIEVISSYYQLKHTTRWNSERTEDETESVAEHVFGMHILIDYFYPLVTDELVLDRELVRHLATWHDMAEAFVGDMTTATKTKEHELREKVAEAHIVNESPAHITDMLRNVYAVYDAREINESKFAKAVDKIEPFFHLYYLSKKKKDCKRYFKGDWTIEKYREHRQPYLTPFPIIKRFDDVLHTYMVNHINA